MIIQHEKVNEWLDSLDDISSGVAPEVYSFNRVVIEPRRYGQTAHVGVAVLAAVAHTYAGDRIPLLQKWHVLNVRTWTQYRGTLAGDVRSFHDAQRAWIDAHHPLDLLETHVKTLNSELDWSKRILWCPGVPRIDLPSDETLLTRVNLFDELYAMENEFREEADL